MIFSVPFRYLFLSVFILSFVPAALRAQELQSRVFGFDDELVIGDIKFNPFNYIPPPMHWGSFKVSPKLDLEQKYTDNVLATETQQQSDFVTRVIPSVKVSKELGRHKAGFQGRASLQKAWEQTSEDIHDFYLGGAALLEGTHSLKFPVFASYQLEHTARENQRVDYSELTVHPVESTLGQVQAGFVLKPNRLSLQMLGTYQQRRYKNDSFIAGGEAVFDDRDFDTLKLDAEIAYEAQANWRPFIKFTGGRDAYLRRSYLTASNSYSGLERSNDLKRVLIGSDFNYKGLVYGEFGVGLENRNYDNPLIESVSIVSVSNKINWEPIEKAKLTLNLFQGTSEDNIISAGIKKSVAGLLMDYELQHDLFLRGNLLYQNENFVDSTRVDKTYGAGVELKYFLTPNFHLGGGYNYGMRDSNQAGSSYNQNSFIFKVTGAF